VKYGEVVKNPEGNTINRFSRYSFVLRLAKDWTVPGSNPGWGEIFHTRPDRLWGPPSLQYEWYRVFPAGKAART